MFLCQAMLHQPVFRSKRQEFRKQIRRQFLFAKFKQLRKSLFKKCVQYEDIEDKMNMPSCSPINQQDKSQTYLANQMRSLSQQLQKYLNTVQDSHLAQIVRKSLKYLQKFEQSNIQKWTDWDVKRLLEKIDGVIKYSIALQKWASDEEEVEKQQEQAAMQNYVDDQARKHSAKSDNTNDGLLKQFLTDYTDLQGLQSQKIDYHQCQKQSSPLTLLQDFTQFLVLQKLFNFLTALSQQKHLPKFHFSEYISQTLIVWLFFSTKNTNFFIRDKVSLGYRSQVNNNIVRDSVQLSRTLHQLYFEVIEKVIEMMGLRGLTDVMFSSLYQLQSIGEFKEVILRRTGDTITCSPCEFMLVWQNKGVKVLNCLLNVMEQELQITQRQLLKTNFDTFVRTGQTNKQTRDFITQQEKLVKKAQALITYLRKQIISRQAISYNDLTERN